MCHASMSMYDLCHQSACLFQISDTIALYVSAPTLSENTFFKAIWPVIILQEA